MKYAWVAAHCDTYPVARLCRQLGVSRTGYCQWAAREESCRSQANSALDARVAALHAESGQSYGRPRLVEALMAEGCRVGHERVRQSLLRQGLKPVYKHPYLVTTDSDHDRPVAPNVLDRRFDGWLPDRAWVADITYLRTDEGWLYLACVMDLGSRRIVGWSMRDHMRANLVCDALTSAYWSRRPEAGLVMHSDRGSQYASEVYCRLLDEYGMVQSMSRRGSCWDNAVMESFFKTLKVERTHRVRYGTRAQARLDTVNWIEGFYNRRRLHSSIGYRSPVNFEQSLLAA